MLSNFWVVLQNCCSTSCKVLSCVTVTILVFKGTCKRLFKNSFCALIRLISALSYPSKTICYFRNSSPTIFVGQQTLTCLSIWIMGNTFESWILRGLIFIFVPIYLHSVMYWIQCLEIVTEKGCISFNMELWFGLEDHWIF